MFDSLKKAFGQKTKKPEAQVAAPPAAAAVPTEPVGERLSDKYPEVAKMGVNLSIRAPFEKIEPTVRGFSMGNDSMANFKFRCKNTECVDGGFDLTEEVDRMVSEYETSGHGRRVCQGWDGKDNVGHQRCYYELNFIINIDYA